jgi:hypothetical protein
MQTNHITHALQPLVVTLSPTATCGTTHCCGLPPCAAAAAAAKALMVAYLWKVLQCSLQSCDTPVHNTK